MLSFKTILFKYGINIPYTLAYKCLIIFSYMYSIYERAICIRKSCAYKQELTA